MAEKNNKSMIDTAIEVLKQNNQKAMSFKTLWSKSAKLLGYKDDEKNDNISNFYTAISLDGRIIPVGGDRWRLRCDSTFQEIENLNKSSAINESDTDEEVNENEDSENNFGSNSDGDNANPSDADNNDSTDNS